ncbi:spore germination protein GerPE [Paenibacillus larvae]|nr:spore germination protein GerPE [Paenibacillus larvae]MDT2247703.1 spore germination protein GerPE [Paenibacillus larvae]MDT2285115.1 spore germination protein GerPE [Paenibacillus larvae]MDT2305275.1 spore germination protein GerPE [Paenibacillus larvae]
MKRISCVTNILINNIDNSSTFICGDTGRIGAKSNVFALHREVPVFIEDEGNFSDYKVFSKKIPTIPLDENLEQEVLNLSPALKWGKSKLTAFQLPLPFRWEATIAWIWRAVS